MSVGCDFESSVEAVRTRGRDGKTKGVACCELRRERMHGMVGLGEEVVCVGMRRALRGVVVKQRLGDRLRIS